MDVHVQIEHTPGAGSCGAAIDVLSAYTAVPRVVAVTAARNVAAQALLRRLDFAPDHARPAVARGEPCVDLVVLRRRA